MHEPSPIFEAAKALSDGTPFDAEMVSRLTEELESIRKDTTRNADAAERGRIIVALYGFSDDRVESASNIIADLLHYVEYQQTSAADPDIALTRGFRYYQVEAATRGR